jgi:DNA-binding transcriptional LysR family regulator
VVSAGLGVSVVPREISRLHSAAGRLQTVALSDAWARREFSICFRRREDLTPAASACWPTWPPGAPLPPPA